MCEAVNYCPVNNHAYCSRSVGGLSLSLSLSVWAYVSFMCVQCALRVKPAAIKLSIFALPVMNVIWGQRSGDDRGS